MNSNAFIVALQLLFDEYLNETGNVEVVERDLELALDEWLEYNGTDEDEDDGTVL